MQRYYFAAGLSKPDQLSVNECLGSSGPFLIAPICIWFGDRYSLIACLDDLEAYRAGVRKKATISFDSLVLFFLSIVILSITMK
jgi:hypothetical protein